ncbi:MAG: hypothetical protein L7F78_27305, partial [Syntrophales bacterium LBB04]|nr:hypothetical protein [Syntrophales bacterium LBB04]
LLLARLQNWKSRSRNAEKLFNKFLSDESKCTDLPVYSTVSVRLYNETPVVHLLNLDEDLFVEQYHLPDMGEKQMVDLVKRFDCIGRHVPVLQYRTDTVAARLFLSHFRRLKKEAGTIDFTERLFQRAAEQSRK